MVVPMLWARSKMYSFGGKRSSRGWPSSTNGCGRVRSSWDCQVWCWNGWRWEAKCKEG